MSFPHCNDLIAQKKIHMPWWKRLGNPCQCEECGKIIAYRTFLSLLMKSNTWENHFICGVCWKAMTSKHSLKSHWLIHTGEKLICLLCGKSFNKRCNFCVQYHTHRHTHRRDLCRKSFRVLCLSSTNITSWLKSLMIVGSAGKGLSQDIS